MARPLILEDGPRWDDAEVVVRPLLPFGRYPRKVFLQPDAAFWTECDLLFWAVRCESRPFVGERQWITVEEARLAAALTLSVASDEGVVSPYPAAKCFRLVGDARLDEVDSIKQIGDLLRRVPLIHGDDFFQEPLIPLPGSKCFSLIDAPDLQGRGLQAFHAVDCNDSLMMRGLGALLKAPMLAEHFCFHTEACISLHVAMEASGELIRRHLASRGRPNSYVDAGNYLSEIFDEEPRHERYFADFYGDRIKAIHPASRFGAFPDAPMQADDFYALHAALRDVYFALLTHSWR